MLHPKRSVNGVFMIQRRKTIFPVLLMLLVPGLSAWAEPVLRLGFAGDIMVHNTQLRRAWLGEDDSGGDRGYDFNGSFERIAPYLQAPDFMIGNLETTFGGPNSAWVTDERYAFREYQAYPCFTTPDALAAALVKAGFNLVGTANNHSMDSHLEGVERTLDVLGAAGLASTGTARRGAPIPWRGEIGGFRISILSWTASTNGLIAPKGMERVNVFSARGRDSRLEDMLKDIRRESARKNDLTILCIHWGAEYRGEPDRYQRNLAALAVEAGADIIIGSHPHVFQPVERRLVESGEGIREVFIAWSMGNFLASQPYRKGAREWTDGSALLSLEVVRGSDGRARVRAAEALPVYVQWTQEQIRVLPAGEALAAGGTEKFALTDYDITRLNALEAWIPGQFTRYLGPLPAKKTGFVWRAEFPEPVDWMNADGHR